MSDAIRTIDLTKVNEQEFNANQRGYGLHKIKQANKAAFVQVIKENLFQLIQTRYLSNAELGLIYSLHPLIEMHTNALCNPDGQFLTVSDIANFLNRNLSGTSRTINTLIEKGLVYEFVNAFELKQFKRSVSKRPLFLNPEIVYCGDRNKMDATLCRLVLNADRLEEKHVPLKWKLWLFPNETHGRLYTRSTYLKYRAKRKG